MNRRIAFTGASGTGKTTLAKYLAESLALEVNPIGSRSVAKAMGFDSPYDVDAAGKRSEFQRRLLEEKRAWENEHDSFVTDRTTIDNLAYTALHNVESIYEETIASVLDGFERYTHVFFCPIDSFCSPGDDPARVSSLAYHRIYEAQIQGLINHASAALGGGRRGFPKYFVVWAREAEDRRSFVSACATGGVDVFQKS